MSYLIIEKLDLDRYEIYLINLYVDSKFYFLVIIVIIQNNIFHQILLQNADVYE